MKRQSSPAVRRRHETDYSGCLGDNSGIGEGDMSSWADMSNAEKIAWCERGAANMMDNFVRYHEIDWEEECCGLQKCRIIMLHSWWIDCVNAIALRWIDDLDLSCGDKDTDWYPDIDWDYIAPSMTP